MAKKNTFLLVSLSESQTKDLAQAISNETCRKILDFLSEKEATETDLASSLGIPISTVHYNLAQLQKGGLVEVEEFHYSSRGKEVNHYKLANKYIIIAPRTVYGLKEKLKSVLPTMGIVAGGALALGYLQDKLFLTASQTMNAAPMLAKSAVDTVTDSAPMLAQRSADIAEEAARSATPMLAERSIAAAQEAATGGAINATEIATSTLGTPDVVSVAHTIWQEPVTWFIIGAVIAIAVYLIIDYKRR